MQDSEGVLAVLSGRVDAAADVEAVLGAVVAGQAAEYLLLCLEGAYAARWNPRSATAATQRRRQTVTALAPLLAEAYHQRREHETGS